MQPPKRRLRLNPGNRSFDLNDAQFLDPISMTDSIRHFCDSSNQAVPQAAVQMARYMFDSLALSYRDVKGQIESLCKRKLKRIRIVGGGCRNKMLNQLCANACELPVMAGRVEASTLGNVSAQLIALGVVENLTAARDMVRRSFPLEECLPKDAAPENVRERFVEIQREKVPCA